jgi:hypothetical protein
MKQIHFKFLLIVSLFFLTAGLLAGPKAYAFSSGGTGADGALEPTQNVELTVPENGTFNYTTINIPTGVTVTFKKNVSNSPIIMLATGDVTISGTISVNGSNGSTTAPGAGGPGGYNGGIGGTYSASGQRGEGPGGGGYGIGGSHSDYSGGGAGAGYFTTGSNGGAISGYTPGTGGSVYGNEKISPLIGGSGGGGGGGTTNGIGAAGGGGGGAILIASSGSITLSGSITANGGNGGCLNTASCAGGGSGGSIRLIANYITGNGSIYAKYGNGGTGSWNGYCNGGNGSKGRIRLEAITVSSSFTVDPNPASIQQNIADNHLIFPTDAPTLTIASVGGVQVPSAPKGLIGAPDVTVPYNVTNPVTVVVNAKNISTGTTVTVKASPSSGSQTSATGTLSGTIDSSSASISLTISTSYPSLLTASVTIVVTAANGGPIYAEGEKVEKMRIETAMGGGQKMFYITESGREIPVKQYGS